jgi:ribonuclease HI
MARRPRRKGGTLKDGERRQLARASRHGPASLPEPAECALVLCDGGSRGNPGTAAIAALLLAPGGGEVVEQRAVLIGHATAAEAEYRAILLGLSLAALHGVEALEVRSDSQLAIAALRSSTPGVVEHAALVDEVRSVAAELGTVRWRWHPRTANEAADELVRSLLWP